MYRAELPEAPFLLWLKALKDKQAVGIIQARLNRIRLGNFGDCKSVGSGVEELRVDHGPGYRIYFGRDGKTVVVLSCAGNKSRQSADIAKAREYWKEYVNDKY